MGTYVNPGNEGFARILRGEYVDKTGIIELVNAAFFRSANPLVCVTRPRRFGKSYAAKALVAYYSCGCESSALFDGLAISREADFAEHLNQYHVISLDMAEICERFGPNVTPGIERVVIAELRDLVPNAGKRDEGLGGEMASAIIDVVRATGKQFVFVIDEWDAVYRLAKDDADAQLRYAEWLRSLFKSNTFTPLAVAGAYMTGILPIKKYGHQSAISDFDEYTMVDPFVFAPYVGFTEDEVEALCARYGLDIDEVRAWYDGYDLPRAGHVYAPYSLMLACRNGSVGSYWPKSDMYSVLLDYVDMNFDGLRDTVVRLLGGGEETVDPWDFANDMVNIGSANAVLVLFVHLGYLAYDRESKTVRIPNEEIREEFRRALKGSRHAEVARIVRESEDLLRATWRKDAEAVAASLQAAHQTQTSTWFYNDEQALRAVVKAAYIAAADYYARAEELESGRGRADVVYLPKVGSHYPALVIELKWNKDAESALDQIRKRDYPDLLRDWGGTVLLVGVNYDPETREHSCEIEELAG